MEAFVGTLVTSVAHARVLPLEGRCNKASIPSIHLRVCQQRVQLRVAGACHAS